MNRFGFLTVLLPLYLAACATQPLPKSAYSPTKPENIRFYFSDRPPFEEYENLGNVTASEVAFPTQGVADVTPVHPDDFGSATASDALGSGSAFSTGTGPRHQVRMQAAALGADAVIITNGHANVPSDPLGAPVSVTTVTVTGIAIRFKRLHPPPSRETIVQSNAPASIGLPSSQREGAVASATRALNLEAQRSADAEMGPVRDLPLPRMTEEEIVTMRQFIVAATKVDRRRWGYGSLAGMEFLTRADSDQSRWIINGMERGQWILNAVLPREFQARISVPCSSIVDDQQPTALVRNPLDTKPLEFHDDVNTLAWGGLGTPRLANSELASDARGASAVNINVHNEDTGIAITMATAWRERVLQATPRLPVWMVVGLIGRFGILREPFVLVQNLQIGNRFNIGFDDPAGSFYGPGTLWISAEETKRMMQGIGTSAFLPLGKLFVEFPPTDQTSALWASEAGLFARWGMLGDGRRDPAMRKAFFRFVQRARDEPVTERLFAECFGFNYSEMEKILRAFLSQKIGVSTSIPPDVEPLNLFDYRIREASADEVGRILGDWLRMKGEALKSIDPGLSREFLGSAGRILWRAYQTDSGLAAETDAVKPSGYGARASTTTAARKTPIVATANHIHDPALLAVFGLYENDIRDSTKARELLEAACERRVIRPEAYLVLSQLRYAQAMASLADSKSRLNAEQAAFILAPLAIVRQQSPALPETYGVFIDTWLKSAGNAQSSIFQAVLEGAALFPRDAALTYRAAYACGMHGYTAAALAIVNRSARFLSDRPDVLAQFERLRAALITSKD